MLIFYNKLAFCPLINCICPAFLQSIDIVVDKTVGKVIQGPISTAVPLEKQRSLTLHSATHSQAVETVTAVAVSAKPQTTHPHHHTRSKTTSSDIHKRKPQKSDNIFKCTLGCEQIFENAKLMLQHEMTQCQHRTVICEACTASSVFYV